MVAAMRKALATRFCNFLSPGPDDLSSSDVLDRVRPSHEAKWPSVLNLLMSVHDLGEDRLRRNDCRFRRSRFRIHSTNLLQFWLRITWAVLARYQRSLSGGRNAESWPNSSSREKIFRSSGAMNNLAQRRVGPYQQGLRFETPVGNGILR